MTTTVQTTAKWGCSEDCHWYKYLIHGEKCLCGKEKLMKRKDYQPVEFHKVKTRKKRK
jgi:hypothetical protein